MSASNAASIVSKSAFRKRRAGRQVMNSRTDPDPTIQCTGRRSGSVLYRASTLSQRFWPVGYWPSRRVAFGRHENLDAVRQAGLTADKAGAFEGENRRVDRRRGRAEVPLDVGLGGRPPVHACVSVDEGQIPALLGRAAGSIAARHLIHLSIHRGLQPGGCDECTLSCHVDPIRARRAWSAPERGQAPGAEASGRRSCWPRMRVSAMRIPL